MLLLLLKFALPRHKFCILISCLFEIFQRTLFGIREIELDGL